MARLALAAGSLLILLVVLEILVRAGGLFAESRAAASEAAEAGPAADASGSPVLLLHPFLGYAGNPRHERGLIDAVYLHRIFPGEPSGYYRRNQRINSHGFPSEHGDYAALEGGFHVGIFGGSMAEQLASVGGEALIERLSIRLPERRPVRVLNFAIGGYKQPQQLIALALAALQGIRLDVVVNLDGFNEVALSGADAEAGHDPLFPSRAHYLPLLELRDPERASEDLILGLAGAIDARRAAEAWRARCRERGLCASELARALVGRLVLWHRARAASLEEAARSGPAGPARSWRSCLDRGDPSEACRERIADLWEEGSLAMAAIARRLGAQYVHALQPNQYVEGSRTLTPRERAIAYNPQNERSRHARAGYPLLRQRIPGMAERGVEVLDLTGLFGELEEDVYVDVCCHTNLLGTEMLARAIADRVR